MKTTPISAVTDFLYYWDHGRLTSARMQIGAEKSGFQLCFTGERDFGNKVSFHAPFQT
ncbi:hypothetical protein [Paracoccus sediminicola]|uniref:hypothetical protein n=1 Tax=Paracoccus sediminicola TaxID=3017783 RepID=UPI0022F08DBE|nr:hypothetical protein [Paracoccus sediminicola]WBU56320.1 hypothetical protein PAF18_12660 [Paracoccus sediminicola]